MLLVAGAAWYGTQEELDALILALKNNCACVHDSDGRLTNECQPHISYLNDQRWLDGLITSRRMSQKLTTEEFVVKKGKQ